MSPTQSMSLPPELPRESSFLRRLFISLKTLNVLKDEAANPGKAWLLHTAMDDRTYESLARQLRPAHEALFNAKPTVPGMSLEQLSTYPEGSLGRVFSGYFQKNGIFPFTYEFPLQSDADFLYKRYRETHDVHHMLTGYGIDDFGEIEIQAFYIANLGLRHAKLIVFAGVPYLMFKERSISKVIKRLRAAYEHGKRSQNVLGLPYEEMWNQPLAELSARYCPRAV
ncbi:MAG: Coq4 family protein [Myxococcaceae bacterium]